MPLPLFLAIGAAAAAGAGIHNVVKAENDKMKSAKERHERNLEKFREQNLAANYALDRLGNLELEILHSFEDFSNVFEKIQNCPCFPPYYKNKVLCIPWFLYMGEEKLKKAYDGAGVLLRTIQGGNVGTAGYFAIEGAAAAASMVPGTTSTGAEIDSASEIEIANAVFAALGGRTFSAGDGSMALSVPVLGPGTCTSENQLEKCMPALSDIADEAYVQAEKEEAKINRICSYMQNLSLMADTYRVSLSEVSEIYKMNLHHLKYMINVEHKTEWNDFTPNEQLSTENIVLLVSLLYDMCEVKLVLKNQIKNEYEYEVNHFRIFHAISDAEKFLSDRGLKERQRVSPFADIQFSDAFI